MKKRILIICILSVIVIACAFLLFSSNEVKAPSHSETENTQDTPLVTDQNQPFDTAKFSIDEPDSIWVIVNKKRPLESTYIPGDLRAVNVTKRTDKSADELSMRDVAATALEELFAAAEKDELYLLLGSGFRSYDLQRQYYESYVASYGQEKADTFSARPGTSEHQTGLVADVSGKSMTCYLEICFANQPEGQWLIKNAYKYGFIIRYQQGKEDITGYQYEPWHLRYVGTELAEQIKMSGATLEEFFNL